MAVAIGFDVIALAVVLEDVGVELVDVGVDDVDETEEELSKIESFSYLE